MNSLYKNDKRFKEAYLNKFDGYYNSGDAGYFDDDGYLYIMSRVDDVINVAGVRLSTGAMEEVISEHPAVAECCVVGPNDEMKGQVPLALVVLKSGVEIDSKKLENELITDIKTRIGKVAHLHKIGVVKMLPKTRSGKILRASIKQLADGQTIKVPPTIEDEDTLNIVIESLNSLGYKVKREQIKRE